MTLPLAARTVYSCEEHGEVDVPLGELLTDGALDVYEEIASRGFFDLSHRRGRLVLRATKFVGLIPLSDRVAIHVRPKVPIANLAHMICKGGVAPDALRNAMRTYAARESEVDTPELLYRTAFFAALEDLARQGILKQYVTEINDRDWKGSLSVSRSVGRYYARGIRYRHAFRQTKLTADNTANRIIKRYARRVLETLETNPQRDGAMRAKGAHALLALLTPVIESQLSLEDVLAAPRTAIRGLPSTHAHYEAPLWLAYLIASRSGIALEELGPVRLESVVVDMSVVFENYVRRLCQDARETVFRSRVRDGNSEPCELFREGRRHTVSPDICFERDGLIVALADAKYKHRPSEADRYEVIAYCEATGARHAAFVAPRVGGTPALETIGRTERFTLSMVRIDLGNTDILAEEAQFTAALASALLLA